MLAIAHFLEALAVGFFASPSEGRLRAYLLIDLSARGSCPLVYQFKDIFANFCPFLAIFKSLPSVLFERLSVVSRIVFFCSLFSQAPKSDFSQAPKPDEYEHEYELGIDLNKRLSIAP